jgi:hypothetical protein
MAFKCKRLSLSNLTSSSCASLTFCSTSCRSYHSRAFCCFISSNFRLLSNSNCCPGLTLLTNSFYLYFLISSCCWCASSNLCKSYLLFNRSSSFYRFSYSAFACTWSISSCLSVSLYFYICSFLDFSSSWYWLKLWLTNSDHSLSDISLDC